MKKLKLVIVVGCLLGGALVVGIGAFLFGSKLSQNEGASCPTTHAHYQAVIQDNTVEPTHIHARLCDSLTITNKDAQHRLIAFGEHDEHKEYDGISERRLDATQSFTIQLRKSGTYHFHDHLQDSVTGYFTVSN